MGRRNIVPPQHPAVTWQRVSIERGGQTAARSALGKPGLRHRTGGQPRHGHIRVGAASQSRTLLVPAGVGKPPSLSRSFQRRGDESALNRIIAKLWHSIRGPLQWRILWLTHAKFTVGVTGVVRDDQGRVLVLRHRLWSKRHPWGLPTGCAAKGEDFRETVVREVREETGLEVKTGRLIHLKSGYRLRVEVAYEALLIGGILKIDPFEILEAHWFALDELPEGMQQSHRMLALGQPPTA